MGFTKLNDQLGKNVIMNPSFDLWQRGTSFAAIAHAAYHADRFLIGESSPAVITVDRSTDVPPDSLSSYSLRYLVTTAHAAITGSEYCTLIQRVEGFNSRRLLGKNLRLSFWVKSSVAGTYSIYISNGLQDRNIVKSYTIDAADTWQKISIPIKHERIGTWDMTNGLGMYVGWALASGPGYQTASEDWQAPIVLAKSDQVNWLATISNEFKITEISLHEGVEEIPFQELMRDFGTELRLCQRYFQKTYNLDVPPGDTGPSAGDGALRQRALADTSQGYIHFNWKFPVPMRISPACLCYSHGTGASGVMKIIGSGDMSVGLAKQSPSGFYVENTSTLVNGSYYEAQLTADAEI